LPQFLAGQFASPINPLTQLQYAFSRPPEHQRNSGG
jgi:hypothetical protein